MNRRDFVTLSILGGLGLTARRSMGASLAERLAARKIEFLRERTGGMLFPRPLREALVEISPPGFAWLPAEGSSGYRLEIARAAGGTVYRKTFGADPVHLPDEVLEPGEYRWDVVALDDDGHEAARRGWQSFAIPAGVPQLPWVEPQALLARLPEGHPRLIYPRAELPEIRSTLTTTRRRSWESVREDAEKALKMGLPRYPIYQHTEDPAQARLEYKAYTLYLRPFVNEALMHLSLAFLMTEEPRYGEAGKRMLLELASWPVDGETSVSANIRGRLMDEPGLSLARCMHRAYDWLYDAMTPDERRRVLAACEARAWQAYRRLQGGHDYLTRPGESHAARIFAYLAEMAVAMAGEAEGAASWLEYSLKGLTTFYPHWGGEDGGWAEGISYGIEYNGHYMPALEALRIGTGYNVWQRPFYRNIRHFFFYCTAPRAEMRPFGDNAEHPIEKWTHQKSANLRNLMAHHAHLFGDPHTGWWVEQMGGGDYGTTELALVFPDELPSTPPRSIPQARVFRDVGWAGLHSDLSKPESDTFFLFKSTPYGAVSHSHADQNAFTVMKGGTALAIASGYYGPARGMPHHAKWTRATKGNNSILVNGEGQEIGPASTGRISDFEDRRGLAYVAGDAAPAYGGRLTRCDRHVLFLRPGLFLLLDDLEAPAPARYQWLLHALDEMRVDGRAGQAISARNGATLLVHLRSPEGLELSQTDQFETPYNTGVPKDFQQDLPNQWHLTAETGRASAATRIGAALAVRGPGEALDVELLELEGWFGARATGVEGSCEGWVQLLPGAPGPAGYGVEVAAGRALVCGKAADGERFVRGPQAGSTRGAR